MQNLENLDVFEILTTQKTAKMPEGPFCQIGAHMLAGLNFEERFVRNSLPIQAHFSLYPIYACRAQF